MHSGGGAADRDKRGGVCKTIEYLFRKAEELSEIREFVITCSLAEIYLDQVRDLGKAYLTNSDGIFFIIISSILKYIYLYYYIDP